MIRPILRMGDPRLWRTAAPVTEFDTPALHALVADMWDTMAAAGGVGLAAPQIGVELRVVLFGFQRSERYPEAGPVPETVLINPDIVVTDAAPEGGWEGCLSVPGLRGWVCRPRGVRYAGYDAHGTRIERQVTGFHARVVQHECDHLDGILYPMRLDDMRRFGFAEEIARVDETR